MTKNPADDFDDSHILEEHLRLLDEERKIQYLWEILVPTIHPDTNKPIHTRYHRVWDAKIRAISGGLTILQPAKGQWISMEGKLFDERMIPVRIMCTNDEIELISDITASYYKQKAIMFYKVSDHVTVKHYST